MTYTKKLEEIDNYLNYVQNYAYLLLNEDLKMILKEEWHDLIDVAIDALKTKEELLFTQKAQIMMAKNVMCIYRNHKVPWEKVPKYNEKLILKNNKVQLLNKDTIKKIGEWY
tara:strand:+ start:655 stop:990 length:336 start_codon:yes stop_codon:yes gene_type:complete